LAFAIFTFILIGVTHKFNPIVGWEAMGDHSGPMAYSFLKAIGATLWLFYFLEVGGIKKGDFRHGYFEESEERIEWGLLGEADVRRRGGIEKTLW
jgi:hypothetical protein